MDKISKLLVEAEKQSEEAHSLCLTGPLKDAFVAVGTALHLYHEVLTLLDDDATDEDFICAITKHVVKDSKLQERLKLMIFEEEQPRDSAGGNFECSTSSQSRSTKDFEKYFEDKIIKWKAGPGFKNIVGLAYLKEILYGCTLLMPGSKFEKKLQEEGAGRFNKHVVAYGLPGVGKTLIAEAYQEEAKGMNRINVSPADIKNCYVGESEKSLEALFNVAKRNAPIVIFFDEADGLFGTPSRDGNNVSLVDQFLLLLGSAERVQVLAATNFPWELAEAIRRRFDYVINIPLPNRSERKLLFKHYLGEKGSKFTDAELEEVASMTLGYSSSDIMRATSVCLKLPTDTVVKAEAFEEIRSHESKKFAPCRPTHAGAVKMRFSDVDPDLLHFPEISFDDLKCAINISKASSATKATGDSLKSKIDEFTKQFGTEGRYGGSVPTATAVDNTSAQNIPAYNRYEACKCLLDLKKQFHVRPARDGRPNPNLAVSRSSQTAESLPRRTTKRDLQIFGRATLLLQFKWMEELNARVDTKPVILAAQVKTDDVVTSLAMCLLQLSCIETMVKEEDIECDRCMKDIKMMWNTILEDISKLQQEPKSSTDSANEAIGPGSPNNEKVQAQRSSIDGVIKNAMTTLRNVLKRPSIAPQVQIISNECNGDPPKFCCSQDDDINVTQWADIHADTVYIGVCKGFHVHFAIKSK